MVGKPEVIQERESGLTSGLSLLLRFTGVLRPSFRFVSGADGVLCAPEQIRTRALRSFLSNLRTFCAFEYRALEDFYCLAQINAAQVHQVSDRASGATRGLPL